MTEARARRDELAVLLGRERAAAADFLLTLADFDRRRGWERLGHASLFAFLTRELGLSSGAAQLRLSAARLLPRHPAVEAALRSGRLCISAVGQLARVLTGDNQAELLPRFFGRSAREAAELVAELLPRAEPPLREVVTALPVRPRVVEAIPAQTDPAPPVLALPSSGTAPIVSAGQPGAAVPLHTYEVDPPRSERPRPAEIEPLTADLRRLHLTVSRTLLEKVAAARTGLSHARPGATTEQVLEAALDLLLELQARRKALVKRPRKCSGAAPTSTPTSNRSAHPERSAEGAKSRGPSTPAPNPPLPSRPHVPAEIEREVRLRDDDRCQFPLDAGGVCGSTWQVELDHVHPCALDGPTTAANLRCACAFHNRYAATLALGPALAGVRRRKAALARAVVSPQAGGGAT